MSKRKQDVPTYYQVSKVIGYSEQYIKEIMAGRKVSTLSKKKIERVREDYAENVKEMEERLKEKWSKTGK